MSVAVAQREYVEFPELMTVDAMTPLFRGLGRVDQVITEHNGLRANCLVIVVLDKPAVVYDLLERGTPHEAVTINSDTLTIGWGIGAGRVGVCKLPNSGDRAVIFWLDLCMSSKEMGERANVEVMRQQIRNLAKRAAEHGFKWHHRK